MIRGSRRDFLKTTTGIAGLSTCGLFLPGRALATGAAPDLFRRFAEPPREYTLMPFWFLNDDLEERELRRQLDDFQAHGVFGVVPHARMGLPEKFAFMSDAWLGMLKFCVECAAEREMKVILYDEGMYPSGSCAGRVVAADPRHATRALERRPVGALEADETLVYSDERFMYVDTRSLGTIRGVHPGTDDGEPSAPAAADILNPEAVASFLRLTHDRHFEVLGKHFGDTIIAIFTDEPSLLGRRHKPGVRPWTRGFDRFLQDYLGYDLLPHLFALWQEDEPETRRYRHDFDRALNARLEQVYYQPYSRWCDAHGVGLTGHPAESMDVGTLRYFHIPGQDVVWRYLEPFQEKSLEGPHSTMGKCGSSAKVNHGRTRNLNECFGAYGWELTWEEMRWLTDWLLVRGVDMLCPHAFYYSIRGERRDERPPDVGPNNSWWERYKPYADYARRISWLNAVGRHVCEIAILGAAIRLPWRAARVLFEHQRDFNYLDAGTLLSQARVDSEGIALGEMCYRALIVDGADTVDPGVLEALQPLISAGAVIAYRDRVAGVPLTARGPAELLERLSGLAPPDLRLATAQPDIRYRHVLIEDRHLYFITNEGPSVVETGLWVSAPGEAQWWDPESPRILEYEASDRLRLAPYQSRVLCVGPA